MEPKTVHIVLIGDRNAGKTTFLNSLLHRRDLPVHPHPHFEDSYRKTMQLRSVIGFVEIFDLDPEGEESILRSNFVSTADAVVLAYDITSRDSFDNLVKYKTEPQHVPATFSYPIFVVGLKKDLDSQRNVTTEEAALLAKSWDAPHWEVSAINDDFLELDAVWIEIWHSTHYWQIQGRGHMPPDNSGTQLKKCAVM